MQWEPATAQKLNTFISRIPVFHRHIAEQAVTKKAEELSRLRHAAQIEEEDVIAAFFSDVPSPFYSMMVRLLEQSGFDYKKYGFPKSRKNAK